MNPASPLTPESNPQVAQLLAQLDDPALPDAVGAWPPAPGWIILALVLLAGAIALIVWSVQRYRSTRYKKLAVDKLDELADEANPVNYASSCAALLKQTFISAVPFSRKIIAGLYGNAWLELLYATCKLSRIPLEQQQALATICGDDKYNINNPIDRSLVEKACRYWINHHKIPPVDKLMPLFRNAQENGKTQNNVNAQLVEGR